MLEAYGPWMTVLSLYNWGEPLLNAKTPQFIKEARRYLLRTSISSNLSVRFDLEALLNSGLDYLLVSIDGATQSTYEKYRVGGDLSLVLSNLEKLTARRASMTNCNTFIVWRFLVFEHNRHEIEKVESLARASGVDMLMFAEPYDVSHVDPTISKPAEFLSRNIVFHPLGKRARQSLAAAAEDLDDHIDEVWDHGWASLYQGEEPDQSHAKTCQWLYANVAMDATGRIMPCCYDPVKDPTTIFGHINAGESVFNSREFTATRTYFSDRAKASSPGTACPKCPYQRSSPHINARQAGLYLCMADSGGVLDSDSVNLLATW
jgi:MoaA/NifB/PqqE/SkfB family radical SAM enzyme